METQEQSGQTSGGAGKYIIGVVVVGLIVAGANFFSGKQTNSENARTQSAAVETAVNPTAASAEKAAPETVSSTAATTPSAIEVDYTDQGFTPATVTIKTGDTVKFVNKSSEAMWVGSNNHPSHSIYSGTRLREHCPDTAGAAFDQCGAGNEYSFTFGKIGSWRYHNHVDAAMEGVVIVK